MRRKTRIKVMDPSLPPPVEEIIAELADSDQPLGMGKLAELSGLTTAELALFTHTWSAIEQGRRRRIVSRLVELAEDNLKLDFQVIFKYCLDDPDAEVRRQAIEGLWESEKTSLIDPLINLLEKDDSEKVQAAAAVAIGKFTLLAEHQKLTDEQMYRIQKSLLAALSDKNKSPEVGRRALEAAAPMSIPEVKKAIEDAYESRDMKLKISSIYAMGKSCDTGWLPALLRELSNPEAEVRYEAAGACGELEEESAVPRLIELIDDFDTDVQMAAIQALGKIGNLEAKECLQQCLENENELVRETAGQVLNKLVTFQDPLPFQL